MIWWISIAVLFVILFVLLIITKVSITVHYKHKSDEDSLNITFKAWHFLSYTYKAPFIALDQDSSSLVVKQQKKAKGGQTNKSRSKVGIDDILKKMKDLYNLLERIEGTHKIVKRFLRRVKVSHFKWHTLFGLGDAALTGTVSGVLWMLKGNIVGLMSHYTDLEENADLFIQPLFQGTHSQIHLSCMISFRIGHAMRAGLQIVKFWKGRQPTCQKNIQSKA